MEVETFEDDIDGSVHSIHVRNFFCHENLEINLNRNVNFIVGRNGSGKSAILTALVVGLGGRASATNRGSNLHSFIKKGASSATIEIKIKNSSPKAYKHNIYGDFITIVRHINASGGSSYKVKSASGEVISTKFEEVNSIILAHDIQVDNPISVLNQDDAQSFHASDAKKKYSLFRKATNLDQTETNYMRALENCNKANAIWNKKNEACKELEKEYKKWKTRYDQFQSKDEIQQKKQQLQNEYYWSEIAELEAQVQPIQTNYNKQKKRVERLVEKLRQMTDSFGNDSSTIDKLKQELKKNNTEKLNVEQELHSLEGSVRELRASWRSARDAAAKHNELLAREQRKLRDLETEIQDIDSGRSSSARAEAERVLSEARSAAAAARARYDTAQHDAEAARANLAHHQPRADEAHHRAASQRDRLKQLKQQARELESRGSDSLAVYGNNMVELCQRVKQAFAKGEFSAMPRGPIGAYIKVKDKKWGGALEHIIGGCIHWFCVNTTEDSQKLYEIMRKVYGNGAKPGVTCSKFLSSRHDTARTSVRARSHCSALDAVHVTDHVVANFLIDHIGMERVLLVPTHDEAIRLSDTAENVPMNCAKVVTLDSTEFFPAPSYRSYGGSARPARFLHLSTSERINQIKLEINEAEQALKMLEREESSLNAEVKQAREAERAADRALQALVGARHSAEKAERNAADKLQQLHAPHHAVLVDELNICKDKVQKLSKHIESLSSKESGYKEKMDEYDSQMIKLKTCLEQVTTTCRTLSEEIEQEQLKRDQGASERLTLEQRLEEDQNKTAQVEAVLEEKTRVLQQKTQEALQLCPRVENPRDMTTVTNDLKKTQLKLTSLASDGLSRAQTAERLLDVERKYRRTHLTLERLSALIQDIKKTTDTHLNYCQRMQTYIAKKVQHCFQSILTLRGYTGSMRIDNARGALEVACAGRGGAARAAGSTAALSGGERSYSTVAFIMALWDCVDLPFYFMDEFDVFMDNVNRKIVMELLIDHALKNTTRQYVFLTPQDASSVTAGPNISIHLMADPRP